MAELLDHGLFRALWSNDEATLRRALRSLSAHGDRTIGQRERRMIPMLRGMGKMHEILELAGEQAKRDVRKAVPPMYGMARLAGAPSGPSRPGPGPGRRSGRCWSPSRCWGG